MQKSVCVSVSRGKRLLKCESQFESALSIKKINRNAEFSALRFFLSILLRNALRPGKSVGLLQRISLRIQFERCLRNRKHVDPTTLDQ